MATSKIKGKTKTTAVINPNDVTVYSNHVVKDGTLVFYELLLSTKVAIPDGAGIVYFPWTFAGRHDCFAQVTNSASSYGLYGAGDSDHFAVNTGANGIPSGVILFISGFYTTNQ